MRIAVIGGGPAGYTAAIRLNQYGFETILFEKDRLGGECLNWGCIPTKAMVKSADFYNEISNAKDYGVYCDNVSFNYNQIVSRKQSVVNKLVAGLEFLFNKRKIEIINQKVTQINKTNPSFTITTSENEYQADFVLIATGSISAELKSMPFDGKYFLSSRDILSLNSPPQHLTVIGGGTIGCEFASIYSHLGSQVEIIEMLPNLLANEDKEIVSKLSFAFRKRGIKTHLNTLVESYAVNDDKITLKLNNGKTIETDKVLISVGRSAECAIQCIGFDLDKDRNKIVINDAMETSEKNIFAIGDVTGKLMLAHTASQQALIAVDRISDRIKGKEKSDFTALNYNNIPKCTFTYPELASVGLDEEKAGKQEEILVGKFTYMANGKALAMGKTDGLIKIIASKKTRKILGMHIVGAQATELITAGSIMINTGLEIDRLHQVVYAHPTLSEIIVEAVEDLDGLAIHKI